MLGRVFATFQRGPFEGSGAAERRSRLEAHRLLPSPFGDWSERLAADKSGKEGEGLPFPSCAQPSFWLQYASRAVSAVFER
jgi:hypothetical protein